MQAQPMQGAPLLLHLHIPKTAGKTLNHCIFEMYETEPPYDDKTDRVYSGVFYTEGGIADAFVPDEDTRRILRRKDVHAVTGHFSYGLHEWIDRPFQYVTVLRHPIERMLSLYHHLVAVDHDHLIHDEVVSRNLSVHQFITEMHLTEVDNGQTRRIAGAHPAFGECDRAMLRQAQKTLVEGFAVVGLTERFAESLVLMKHRLRWPRVPQLRQDNVNPSRPPHETLSTETLMAILERNQLDLELYAFAERRFQQQIDVEAEELKADLAAVTRAKESGPLAAV